MKRTFITAIAAIMLCIPSFATDTEAPKDEKKKKEVTYNDKGEIIKTGTNFGPLPVVAYDADRGFQFGALLNLYNFGNGDTYPNPKSTWYFEASAYTKEGSIGSYKLIVNYDNKTLIPGVRMSICSGYYKDAALDFYGFNGYQSNYIPVNEMYEDGMFTYLPDKAGEKLQAKGKFPKGFYRFGRDLIKAKVDFTGEIARNFYWEAGYNLAWTKTSDFTPEGYEVLGGETLFDLYKAWGIIPESEAEGGLISGLRLGLMYDSRNVENNPTEGIWAEAHTTLAPKWLGTTDPHYKYCATFRHYVPVIKDGKLTFAYRLAYP